MSVEQRPALRASDRDRDELLVRLHTAYAEGRLAEAELDERIDLALAALTHDDLARIAADLPGRHTAVSAAAETERPGRFQMAYKSEVRRTGSWRLPESYTAAIYKGRCLLDLRGADLSGQVTTLRVLAYKSAVQIVVPPGVRVEIGGLGVSAEVHDAPADAAPVVRVTGVAYKGTIEAIDHLPPC